MRILYLCKRHYMSHDVISDRYARLYEQPRQLAELGNDVLGVCLSYRKCESKDEIHETKNGRLRWIGYSAGNILIKIPFYPLNVLQLATDFKPDIIVGASDCLHIILANWIATKLSIKFSADLYDDYESFGLAKLPFVKKFYRRALYKAQIISCVSQTLAALIKLHYAPNGLVISLPSTIDQSTFYPRNQDHSRDKFNLPRGVPLVGTAGGLSQEKGIKAVYDAFLAIAAERPDVHFVLAGVPDKKLPVPSHERIHFLGKLPHSHIAELFCCLSVGVVYLRNTPYGRVSFPQKAFEMAACKIPMVVSRIGDMELIFSDNNNELYAADDAQELAKVIKQQIDQPAIANIVIENWSDQAKKLLEAYQTVVIC